MKIILNSSILKKELKAIKNLGFVPTMGSIHKGHESLIKKSKKACEYTIVSIYINPTQFNNLNDFKKYPKNINKDLKILKKLKVDLVFIPKTNDIYNFKRSKKISLGHKDKILCAKYRKGHFEGVIDVMDRLTKLIKPNKIFMGEKDYQQFFLLKKFIEKKYPSKIINCKTIRDNKSIALSSRNILLKSKSLKIAANVVKELRNIKKKLNKQKNVKIYLNKKIQNLIKNNKIKLEYLELRNLKNLKTSTTIKNSRLFIAYYIENIRLIDNL
jgi:pantoate--beta-alanine ligase